MVHLGLVGKRFVSMPLWSTLRVYVASWHDVYGFTAELVGIPFFVLAIVAILELSPPIPQPSRVVALLFNLDAIQSLLQSILRVCLT